MSDITETLDTCAFEPGISRRTLVRRVVTLGRAFELHPARPG